MLTRRETLKQIMPAPSGYSLIWSQPPCEGFPIGNHCREPVIAWALIEEVTPGGYDAGGGVHDTIHDLTVEPVTVSEIGWPNARRPVAILAPDGTVHEECGDSYDSVAAWLESAREA